VLIDARAPRTAELLAARGFDPLPLDVAELAKAEAGLSCLGLLVETAPEP
jgi:dimethylargininase